MAFFPSSGASPGIKLTPSSAHVPNIPAVSIFKCNSTYRLLNASTSSLALTALPPNANAATQLATIAKATPRIHLMHHLHGRAILDRKHSLSPIQMPRELMVLCFNVPAPDFPEFGNITILPV